MSSGIGGGISGGVAAGRGRGGTNRKNSKKKTFGKNLNKLTKAPAAPPVPVISAGGGGSSGSFRGSSSSRNGLLLLSTKTKSTASSSGGSSSGLLASGTPKSAHDALLLSAGAGGQGGEAGRKFAPAPAWGVAEKKQQPASDPAPLAPSPQKTEAAAPSPLKEVAESSGRDYEKPELVLDRRDVPVQQHRPYQRPRSARDIADRFAHIDLNRDREAPDRFAHRQEAPDRFAHRQEVPDRFAPDRFTPDRFSHHNHRDVPDRFARHQEVPDRFSYRKEAPDRFSYQKEAPDRFSHQKEAPDRFARHKEVQERFSHHKEVPDRFSSQEEVPDRFARIDKTDSPDKTVPENGTTTTAREEKLIDEPIDKPTRQIDEPKEEKPAIETPVTPQKDEQVKDEQVEYMSKLAKERAEKRRQEEEARMAAQKERAAMRLRELEEKRLEEKKKQLQQQQIKSEARKALSKPQVLLEPLGKPKKEDSNSTSPKATSKSQSTEKSGGRKLYDPERPYSSLVGGKTTKNLVLGEDRRGNKKSASSGPAATDPEKDEPKPALMVRLSNLGDMDRGGRDAGQAGPRMLFDPTSGSMVAAPTKEDPSKSAAKKAKQKGPQKLPSKRSDEVGKVSSRRAAEGGVADEGSDAKLLRGKKGSRKDEATSSQLKSKKSLDSKGRPTGHHQRKRLPRTCGVLYKVDKSGNYVNVDGSTPDNGYGAHRAPGGKAKNSAGYEKLLKQGEDKKTASKPNNSATTPATDGFSFRNDPGFIQHQTDFEAQQQKILEDAWATLVENEEPKGEKSNEEVEGGEEEDNEMPPSKSFNDEYAAALAISPSMIGLNFDANDDKIDSVMLPPAVKASTNASSEEPIDLAKFALEAASTSQPANPFSPMGVSGAGLWGAGAPGASTSFGDLGALTGWDATPFTETDTTAAAAGSTGLNGSSSTSKLHLWGTGLDGLNDGLGAFAAFGSSADASNGAD